MSTDAKSSNPDSLTGSAAGGALLLVGCEPACGKTVIGAGLAAVLAEQGVPARVVKPLRIGAVRPESSEMRFIRSIASTEVDYEIRCLDFPPCLDDGRELILGATRPGSFTIVEIPGTAATPVDINLGAWTSVGEMVAITGLPCLLVCRYSIDALERLDLFYRYLYGCGADVVALVMVETSKNDATIMNDRLSRDDLQILLTNRIGLPFLGVLSYSSSLSVPLVSQGNLKKNIEKDLDLLALRQCVTIPI